VNPRYIQAFEDAGLVFSGTAGNRMEILELPGHPYFLGTQFHPEFRSRPGRASPPFVGFLDAIIGGEGRTGTDDGTEEEEEVTA